jgi:hypothetical protein
MIHDGLLSIKISHLVHEWYCKIVYPWHSLPARFKAKVIYYRFVSYSANWLVWVWNTFLINDINQYLLFEVTYTNINYSTWPSPSKHT